MNIVTENGNSFEIDPNLYNLIRLRAMLSIEVKTGMKHSRGSVMNAIKCYTYTHPVTGNEVYITSKQTKKGVLADLDKFLDMVKSGALS